MRSQQSGYDKNKISPDSIVKSLSINSKGHEVGLPIARGEKVEVARPVVDS